MQKLAWRKGDIDQDGLHQALVNGGAWRSVLDHAGKISAEQAKMKAELEYERYRLLLDSQPRAVDLDFAKAVTEIKKLPNPTKSKPRKK